MKEVTDAEYEVISGPSPVRWEAPRRKPVNGLNVVRLFYGGLIVVIALFTLLMGLAGADLDTTDSVAADQARQPVAPEFR